MLSEYILNKIELIQEKTYNKLVLILAGSSMLSVLLSGISLIVGGWYRYLSPLVLTLGLIAARLVLNSASKKIRKLLTAPEYEKYAERYLAKLKDYYSEDDILIRIDEEPKITDPVVSRELKPLHAARPFVKAKTRVLRTRLRVVLTASALAIAIPQILVARDLLMTFLIIILLVVIREKT